MSFFHRWIGMKSVVIHIHYEEGSKIVPCGQVHTISTVSQVQTIVDMDTDDKKTR